MKKQLLAIITTGLLTLSVGAQAEWARIDSNSNATAYLWYPVEQYFPWAYPATATVWKQALPVAGWTHRARSMLAESTVDCRDGRVKLRRGTLYTGSKLNGYRMRVGYLTLSNGLKIVPGRWYRYAQIPSSGRKNIRLACE